MKIILFAFFMIFSFHASANQKGIGISLGNPTGLNGKYWLEGNKAVDAGFGFSLGDSTDFSIHSDYLLHNEGAFYFNDVHPLDLYFGLGGRMEFADEIEFGARIPVGLSNRSENKSSDIFVEVAPILDFLGRNGLELHFLLGSRYYF